MIISNNVSITFEIKHALWIWCIPTST